MPTIDPRAKLVVLFAFSLLVSGLRGLPASGLALAGAILAAALSGQSPTRLIKRALGLNVFVVFLALTMPWSLAPAPDWPWLAIRFNPGLLPLVLLVCLRMNAAIFMLLGLLGAETPPRILHALAHLGLPNRLTSVFFLFHRYLAVIAREKDVLLTAMRARCFAPGTNRHTYQSYANLVGMLLARSLDRADRVYGAMRCRGFSGMFPILDHFAWTGRDTAFCLAAGIFMSTVLAIELFGGVFWN